MARVESLRLFFALWPDGTLRSRLAAEMAVLRRELPARWIEPDKLHMTLAFLGTTPVSRLAELAEIARSCGTESFSVRLDVLVFWRKPGILCLTPSQVPEGLRNLAEDLTGRLKAARFSQEDRAFRPHLTLARNVSQSVRVEALQVPEFSWPVAGFSLVESVSGNFGSRYGVLGSWALRSAS